METEIVLNNVAEETEVPAHHSVKDVPELQFISGFKKDWIVLRIWLTVLKVVLKNTVNPFRVFFLLKKLEMGRKAYQGNFHLKKLVRFGNNYYYDMYIPHWQSKEYTNSIDAEIKRILKKPGSSSQLSQVMIAITKKCSLSCEHCFEWNALNRQEVLDLDNLKTIVKQFRAKGVEQFILSGGEPLNRLEDIIELLNDNKNSGEFWILTSGYHLTLSKALRLKEAGLNHVVISLDHYLESEHNLFRGNKNSWRWAIAAANNCRKAGILTSFSICVTKDFITRRNLTLYMKLARESGVAFVQFLEPKASGHYANKDVKLEPAEEKLLEEFYVKYNYDERYVDYPPISYHGYYQRRSGCLAAAARNVYVDTDGDMHSCPFCSSKSGSVLNGSIDDSLLNIKTRGCRSYKMFEY